LSTLRIGIPGAPYFDDLEPGIALCVERVLARLQEAGATLVALDARELHRLDVRAGFCVSAFEARTQWWRYCESQLKVSVEAFIASIESADVRAVFEFFASREMFQAQDYADALLDVQAMVRWYDEVFHTQQIDCLLMPSVACEAPTVIESRHSMPFDESAALFAKVARQVSPAALAGIPSISIPMGFSGVTGLPAGLICEGPAGGDRRLLAIAKRIDSLLQ